MIPVARTENILLTEVDNEVMIYDRENDSCHCLNPVAAQVWRYCDGYNTVDDIANLLEQEMELPEDSDMDIRGLVWLALEELERCNLIKEYVREPIPDEVGVSRRKVLGKTAKFAGVVAIGTLFPMVQSIVAPKPVMAASVPTPGPTPGPTPKPTPTPTPTPTPCLGSLSICFVFGRPTGSCCPGLTCKIEEFDVGICRRS
jgi:hypothetical protein